jgi:dUTP pyrophosphatase
MSSESTTVAVRFRRVPEGRDLPAPERATRDSAGFDLRARVEHETEIAPGERCLVPTGIAIALPDGYEAQVRPRSGLALKSGVTLVNSPGTIDSDYRGEIAVIMINHGQESVRIERGDRIAQLVVQRIPRISLEEVESLPESARGEGGFGHSGVR